MTFAAVESSLDGGSPVTLFKFTNGTSQYRYTNHTRPIMYDGLVYEPVVIKTGKISSSGDMGKNQLKISIDWNTPLAALMRGSPPSKEISVILYDGHLSDPDSEFVVSWSGIVLGSSRVKSDVTLTCDSITAAIRGLGLGRDWMLTCPYVVYDGTYCQASKAAATVATAPIAVVGNVLTLPSGWNGALAAEKYLRGIVEWFGGTGPEVRSIIATDGADSITLRGSHIDISAGQSVNVVLGCNRQMDDCVMHNQIVNYGGQPNIPTENPTNRNDF